MNSLKIKGAKVFLWLPFYIHKTTITILLFLFLIIRPKYRKRFELRKKYFDLQGVFEVYSTLYTNLIFSYRYIFKLKVHLEIEISPEVKDLITNKSPTLFWGVHMGAFESLHPILADYYSQHNEVKVHVPVKSSNEFLNGIRSNRGQKLVSSLDPRSLVNVINNKETITLLIDQHSQGAGEYIELDINGKNTELKLWPALLKKAELKGYNIVAMNCIYDGDKWIFKANKIKDVNTGIDEYMGDVLNEYFLKYPNQYVWHYKKSFKNLQ